MNFTLEAIYMEFKRDGRKYTLVSPLILIKQYLDALPNYELITTKELSRKTNIEFRRISEEVTAGNINEYWFKRGRAVSYGNKKTIEDAKKEIAKYE